MRFKGTHSGFSRAFLLLLIVAIALAAVGCSAAPNRGWCGPLVSDNVLYVGTLQGKILAYNLATEDYWARSVAERSGGGFGCTQGMSQAMPMYGTPALWKDRLYVGAYSGDVFWVDIHNEATSGSAFDTGGTIVGSVAIDGDTLYVGSSNGKVYALDLNAKELSSSLKDGWPFETGGKIWSTPVVTDNVVYVSSTDHNLYAIDAKSGNEIWRFETEAAIMSTPLVADGTVYIGGCDRNFYAIDAATEDERMAAGDGASPTVREAKGVFEGASNWYWTQALACNGEIWVGNLDHKIYVLNAANVEEEVHEAYRTGGMIYAPPVLLNGLVVVGSQDGKVYAINAESKDVATYAIDADTLDVIVPPDKPKKRIPAILAPLYADPTSNTVYLHAQGLSGQETLYALRISDGSAEVVWDFRTDKIK